MKKLFLALTIGLAAMACRDKEKDYPACGCEARNDRYEEYTRNEKNQQVIFYSNNTYTIGINYSNIIVRSYICNPDIIPNEIQKQLKDGKQFYVNKYSGYKKNICDENLNINLIYTHSKISNIEIGEEVKTENKLKF